MTTSDPQTSPTPLHEIARRWWKYLLLMLPMVLLACFLGWAQGNALIPTLLIPLLLIPLGFAILLRRVVPAKCPLELVYQGPQSNEQLVREALLKEGIPSVDPDVQGSRRSGGRTECVVYVDRARAKAASQILDRLSREFPTLFQDPPAQV